ncbi:sulfatase-like hydrolase/transferase, partial [Armatimonas sp.]|uniref:sulfatase-like hydrolase/transferase n=1 Tax=Armatimonas sp. TaxID=1872638 RepID=UPI00286BF787
SLFLMALYPLTSYINTFKENSARYIGFSSRLNDDSNYYVIVLDAYARSDKLCSTYGYDNSDFLDELRNNKFYIPTKSMSNHERTMYSLPSFFNMEYIGKLGSPSFTPRYSSLWSKELINNSKFFKIMRNSGYKILTINTGVTFTHVDDSEILYSPFYKNNNLDTVILYPHITDMEYAVFSHTLLTLYFKYHSSFENKVIRRSDIRSGLKTLRSSVDIKGPKVVFAHFLSPHHPFVFDENGKDVDSADTLVGTNRLNVKAYAAQARFISSEIGIFINDLVSEDPNCIVVIVGDHGGRAMIDYDDIEKTDLEDAFANLIAIRLPGVNISSAYDDLTLVNVFRMIFREKYHEDIPLLENRQIFNFRANSKPNDVTDRIKATASARE